jgi:hypothetical protein
MTKFLIPFSLNFVSDCPDTLITIVSNTAHMLGCLYPSSVEIRSALDPHLSPLSTYALDSDYLREHGPNHWIQWVTKSVIAFGTKAGAISISRLSDTTIQPPHVTSISRVITGAFSCYGFLGLCTQDCEVLFLSPDGCVLTSYTFDFGSGGFRNPHFYSPSILASIVNSKPSFLSIPSSSVRKQKKPDLSFFSIQNAVLLASNTTKEILTTASNESHPPQFTFVQSLILLVERNLIGAAEDKVVKKIVGCRTSSGIFRTF